MPVKEEQEQEQEELEEEVFTSSVQNWAVPSMNRKPVDEKKKSEIARVDVKLRKLKQ